jgi:hypothetical protein
VPRVAQIQAHVIPYGVREGKSRSLIPASCLLDEINRVVAASCPERTRYAVILAWLFLTCRGPPATIPLAILPAKK